MKNQTILCAVLIIVLAGCTGSDRRAGKEPTRTPVEQRSSRQIIAPVWQGHVMTPAEDIMMVLSDVVMTYDTPRDICAKLVREVAVDPGHIISSDAFNQFVRFVEQSNQRWHQSHGDADTDEARHVDTISDNLKEIRQGRWIAIRRYKS